MDEEKSRDEAIKFVTETVHGSDVRFVRLWFTDILGSLKGVALNVAELENSLRDGMTFDGASIRSIARNEESDLVLMPDPSTFKVLPWRPSDGAVGKMFCDVYRPDGTPHLGDPRAILKLNLEKAYQLGYTFLLSPETEYYYFKDSCSTETLDTAGYFDQTATDIGTELRRETVLALEEIGIPVEYSHHEVSPSQHEINLRHTDALTMADNVMTYKLAVKEIAQKHGIHASFMPKPVEGLHGNGMHIDMSLFRGDTNEFFKDGGSSDDFISDTAKYFIAGLMKHAKEITAITNQWVNSYKRLVSGFEAPGYISWTKSGSLIRIPSYRKGRENSVRIEYRAPDSACNPYLAFSAILAAGLAGIENKYEIPAPVEQDINKMDQIQRNAHSIESLPTNLSEALHFFENSELMYNCLGEDAFYNFIKNKKLEWDEYSRHVSGYEVDKYLSML
tara:strand:+ start:10902 stop:12245 length:1344 start_codon:yes stop_codon:yes gene_type:complete